MINCESIALSKKSNACQSYRGFSRRWIADMTMFTGAFMRAGFADVADGRLSIMRTKFRHADAE